MRTDLRPILRGRLDRLGLHVSPGAVNRLLAYWALLERWNDKINLTSLTRPEAAVERLLLEPILAADKLPQGGALLDIGSGGGSPAIPLAILTQAANLVMVESRARKSAFLREALRTLEIPGRVETARFEALADQPDFQGAFETVSVRAIKLDRRQVGVVAGFLRPAGILALFRGADQSDPIDNPPPPMEIHATFQLSSHGRSELVLLRKFGDVPRGT